MNSLAGTVTSISFGTCCQTASGCTYELHYYGSSTDALQQHVMNALPKVAEIVTEKALMNIHHSFEIDSQAFASFLKELFDSETAFEKCISYITEVDI